MCERGCGMVFLHNDLNLSALQRFMSCGLNTQQSINSPSFLGHTRQEISNLESNLYRYSFKPGELAISRAWYPLETGKQGKDNARIVHVKINLRVLP